MPRLVDHIDAIEQAGAAGMRAVLFKDHYYPTAPICELIGAGYAHQGVAPLAGIVLNNALGGFNIFALEHALKMGTRIVWMQTVSAANHIREGHRKTLLAAKTEMRRNIAMSVVDDHGNIGEEVLPILDMIAQFDAVMSCRHLHVSEIWPLFAEAKRRGVKRLLVNHPTYTVGASVADIKELVGMGAWIEHWICMFIPSRFTTFTADELADDIDATSTRAISSGAHVTSRKIAAGAPACLTWWCGPAPSLPSAASGAAELNTTGAP